MARINISIPDELEKQIRKYRKKNKINVSAICTRALESQMKQREKKLKRKK